ncbi:MAG: TraR/DksA family transcriptional regulator [Bacteroidetes bacterium]|jgi:DnaK suppressor protein|nr:TraR/DksA family transcriptional regulator [Bacteroidota bacterium]MBT3750402.1 TraR/DksA family transcriptional regulator [Bacteroidota bacterium]MBT4400937.1 TraR/DksA family transcriptional regulator [Bacteroidota bacterium]MBT4410705.1 TraR/DksA family transcriptional regulator [Bacteroidota bacterium]MBT5425765.1 TraR/DksA family transcriptional regulator [Bacteroidota bacterium]
MESEEIKQKILSEIRRTELQIEEYKEMTKPEAPDCAIGRVSRMDAINNRSVTEASLRQARGKLKSLQRVSAQLGTKEFGLCMKCKQPIPIGRILFRPESLFCVNCAQ